MEGTCRGVEEADDIGVHNVSACSFGGMGCRTPNIDRIGKEGARCTGFYAQQS
jgi:arylsulfatase